MKKLLQLATLCIYCILFSHAAFTQGNTYYWVGGAGDWGEGIHWSNTSGGLGGSYLLPPSPLDDVVFDAGSGFGPGNNIVTTSISGITCRNMSWINAPGNPIFEENPETDFVLTGNLVIQADMTFRAQVLFIGNNPATITSNGGKIAGNIYIDKPNTSLTMMDDLMLYNANAANNTSPTLSRTGTIILVRGTFSLNGHTAYANGFISEGANVRHLDIENSVMHFRNPSIGLQSMINQYVNASGAQTNSNYSFVLTGSNRTVSTQNSVIRTEYTYAGFNISGTPQLTFNNIEYRNTTYTTGQTSIFSNSIINKIDLDFSQHHYISSTAGAIIDTVYFGTPGVASTFNNHRGIVNSPSTIFKYIEFRGINNSTNASEFRDRVSGNGLIADKILFNTTTTNPNFTRHSLETGSNSTIKQVFFNSRGNLSGNSNNIQFLEYNVNGIMQGNNNIIDTLVFSPGYTYRFGVGVTNTVNSKWYANGNPCYYTEIYNIGSSSTATVILNQSDPSDFDYIRVWGVTMAGSSSPINAGARSVDIANNTNINFAPYNPLLLLHPFGYDTIAKCHSDFPLNLNTSGFYGNTNTHFTWHDGSTGNQYNVTEPGTYSATADYGRNCYFTATVVILDQLSVDIDELIPNSSIVCDPANPNGSILAIPGGASTGPFTYTWNSTPAQTTQELVNVPAGTYTVTISDGSCSISESATIDGPTNKLSVAINNIFPDCGTAPTGTGYISTTITGGKGPYTYKWNTSPAQTTQYASGLTAGTYRLVVTDSLGCSDSINVVVPAHNGAFTSTISIAQPTGCAQDGAASVTVNGGLSPFTYTWSNNGAETTNTSTSIPVGSHNVLIVDANNCVSNNSFTIVAPDGISPVFTNCPVDTTIFTNGLCGRTYSWNAPTVTDNCSVSTVTSSHNPGYNFPVGVTTVTYTATDIFGNQSTCAFTVTVRDEEKPKFALCPPNITIVANAGNCTATAVWPTPIATDNCGVSTLVGDFASGSVFPVGVTTITYTATDNYGNFETCSFDVIVKANPTNFTVSGCPANRTINLNAAALMSPNDSCATVVALNAPTVNNLCGNWWYGSGPNSYAGGQSYDFSVGTTPVTYYITNGADTLRCNYNIIVNDTWAPFVVPGTAVGTVSVIADTTCNGAYATWTPPTFADNCGIASITSNHQPGAFFNYGNTTVSYTVTDVNARVYTYSFTVSVTNPNTQLTGCPSNMSVPSNTCGGANVSWTPPTPIDNCYTFTSTHNPGDFFPIGTTQVQYNLTPNDGGTVRTCSFNVTVQAPTNQVSNCPSNRNISLPIGKCDTLVTWTPPQFNTFCTIDSIISTHSPGQSFAYGTHNVNYTAYLSNGQTLVCNFTINITAAQAPITVIDCPGGTNNNYVYQIQVDTSALCGAAIASWTEPIFSTSACFSAIDTIEFNSTSGIAIGDTMSLGSLTSISYIAKNGLGNTLASCYFQVTVIDTISRVIVNDCPVDTFIQVNNSFSCDSAVINFGIPTFQSFGCIADMDTMTITAFNYSNWSPIPIQPGDILAVGSYQVIINAIDSNGVTIKSCQFELIIGDTLQSIVNDCPGTFSPSYNMNIYEIIFDSITCSATWDWPAPSFSSIGSCAGIVNQVVQTSGIAAGTVVSSPGTQFVEYSAYDINGFELATCSFLAIAKVHDTIAFNMPASNTYVFYTDPLTCKAIVNWDIPTPSNACNFYAYAGINNYSQNWSINNLSPYNYNSSQLFPIGTYTIQYYLDNYNYTSNMYDITIHVYDGAQPSFNSTCSTDTITMQTNFNVCEATVDWHTPTAVGGPCSGYSLLPIETTHHQGTTLPIGYSTITYTATTPGGLTATCSFVVEVVDLQDPSIYNCPSDITIEANSNCSATATWTEPSYFDNCQNTILTSSHSPGDLFPMGTTIVTHTATDAAGNVSTCTFNVNVVDNTSPVFAGCPQNIVVNSQTGLCGANVSWMEPTATDACNLTITPSHASGDLFPIGTTTVSYIAEDVNGNSSTCSFTITVIDQTSPVVTNCPSDITVFTDTDACGAIVTWAEPTATDECAYTLVSSHPPGSTFPVGYTLVKYTATDNGGNSTVCTFAVIVIDNQAPVLTGCPNNITVDSEESICGAVVTWTSPTVSDNCSNATITSSHNSGDVFPIGTSTVVYTAADSSGNVTICSFDVTVTDVTYPDLLNCPSDISINALHNICAAPAYWSTPTIVDPCSNSVISSTHQSGELFNVGTTNVVYTITDGAGNQSTCAFDVTVSDVSAPQITACPQNQTLQVEEGSCSAVAGWVTPIAIDNCSGVSLISSHNSLDTFAIGTTHVTYMATDDQGLQAVCSFTITVIDPNNNCEGGTNPSTPVIVPNAFTPDGDGTNDVLVIQGIEDYPENELIIFNRWGNEVYRMVGYANQWDGKMNVGKGLEGSDLPTGTYYYVLDTNNKQVGVLKGFIYLQR